MGPDFVAGDDSKRFLYFTADNQPVCFFKPHYAFSKVPGVQPEVSLLADERRPRLPRTRWQPLTITGTTSLSSIPTRTARNAVSSLMSRQWRAEKAQARRAEVSEYLDTAVPGSQHALQRGLHRRLGHPLHVGTRLRCRSRVLGGRCGMRRVRRPAIQESRRTTPRKPAESARSFKVVSVEREHPFDALKANGEEYWNWTDAANLYRNWWTQEQRVQFDAYRLRASPHQLSQRRSAAESRRVREVEERRRSFGCV